MNDPVARCSWSAKIEHHGIVARGLRDLPNFLSSARAVHKPVRTLSRMRSHSSCAVDTIVKSPILRRSCGPRVQPLVAAYIRQGSTVRFPIHTVRATSHTGCGCRSTRRPLLHSPWRRQRLGSCRRRAFSARCAACVSGNSLDSDRQRISAKQSRRFADSVVG
jgi:hypothetical protein